MIIIVFGLIAVFIAMIGMVVAIKTDILPERKAIDEENDVKNHNK